MGRLQRLYLHAEPRFERLEQRPSLSARDSSGQFLPPSAPGPASGADRPPVRGDGRKVKIGCRAESRVWGLAQNGPRFSQKMADRLGDAGAECEVDSQGHELG